LCHFRKETIRPLGFHSKMSSLYLFGVTTLHEILPGLRGIQFNSNLCLILNILHLFTEKHLNCERYSLRTVSLRHSRIRIDIKSEGGEKLTVTMEGHISRKRAVQILDFIDLLGGASDQQGIESQADMTKFEKIRILVGRRFPAGWFTSQDIMVAYEDLFEEPIGLSTVSTYLARLVERDILLKSGSPANRRYRMRQEKIDSERETMLP